MADLHVRFRVQEQGPVHKRITVFVGPDNDHLAHTGVLVMRNDEADRFVDLLKESSGNADTFTTRFIDQG